MNFSARDIRVDQSHCNYHLAIHLEELGWDILFRDPGRASRGFAGSQEILLGVFERNSLPIPDIVGRKGSELLLIEVDKSIRNNIDSMTRYRQSETLILNELAVAGYICERLAIGFCKVGGATEKDKAAVIQAGGLLLADFPEPLPPRLQWL